MAHETPAQRSFDAASVEISASMFFLYLGRLCARQIGQAPRVPAVSERARPRSAFAAEPERGVLFPCPAEGPPWRGNPDSCYVRVVQELVECIRPSGRRKVNLRHRGFAAAVAAAAVDGMGAPTSSIECLGHAGPACEELHHLALASRGRTGRPPRRPLTSAARGGAAARR